MLIQSLYAVNGVVAVLLYIPQIVNLLRNRSHAQSVSMFTFGGWCIGSVITTLYAWSCARDPMFAAVSLANLAGAGAVFSILAWQRTVKHRLKSTPLGPPLSGGKH